MSGGSSWRSPLAAEQYADHDFVDFAQEFLRRDPDYHADHAATQLRIAADPTLAANEQEGLARRWGLSFPLRTRRRSARDAGALVT